MEGEGKVVMKRRRTSLLFREDSLSHRGIEGRGRSSVDRCRRGEGELRLRVIGKASIEDGDGLLPVVLHLEEEDSLHVIRKVGTCANNEERHLELVSSRRLRTVRMSDPRVRASKN